MRRFRLLRRFLHLEAGTVFILSKSGYQYLAEGVILPRKKVEESPQWFRKIGAEGEDLVCACPCHDAHEDGPCCSKVKG